MPLRLFLQGAGRVDWGKYTGLYFSGRVWYLRICPVETCRFPHGISLATGSENKAEILAYQVAVEEYLEDCFGLDNFTDEELEAELEKRKKENAQAENSDG